MQEIIIILLITVLVVREWMNARERRDLLDRIMSRDFDDYLQSQDVEEENNFQEEDPNIVPILDAEEDFING